MPRLRNAPPCSPTCMATTVAVSYIARTVFLNIYTGVGGEASGGGNKASSRVQISSEQLLEVAFHVLAGKLAHECN